MKSIHALLIALLLAPLAALHAAETSSQPAQTDMERALLQGFAHPPVQFAPGAQYGPDKRNYQGIPTLARAPHGRLWAAWYAGKIWEDKYNYVLAATSGDDGETWSAPTLVIDPDGDGDRRASDPCFWLDPGGKLWLFWWMNGGGLNVTLAITTEHPDDEHPVWTKPRALFPGVMLNKPTVLKNGDWLMPAAIWNRDDSARVMTTRDGGKTFSLLGAANIPPDRRNADEHMIVERKDGSLMMLVRTDKHGIGRSISSDGGRTWTGVEDYLPHATSRFFLRRLASGNLLLIKHGPIDKRIDRSELTAYLSEDDGETWKGGLLIDRRKSVSYPDGIQAPDGRIYLIYDWERARDKNILMATFTESDVLARAFSPGGRERVLINHATGVNPTLTVKPVAIDLAKRTWQGIPGLERTAKGRVFVSWFTGGTKEPEPENTVVLSHSDDGGKTFSAPQAMALPLSDGTRCYDPCLWIDPRGRLWYLFNRSVKDSTRHGVYARICERPDATPPVWGAEFRVGFDGPFSFRMNKPIVLSSGEWVLPVVHSLEPLAGWAGFDPKQVFGAAISTDEGMTWKLHGAVKTAKAGLENMIVELKDGRLWMLIRTEKALWDSHSADKGRTWTEGKPTTIATPHSRFFIRRLASGSLLLVNHYKFTGRSHLTAQLSNDDGATWNDGLLLDERSGVSYPDGLQAKDGLIWITYDRDRGGAGEILLAKFKEEDVIAGKNVSGAVSLKQVVDKLDKPASAPKPSPAELPASIRPTPKWTARAAEDAKQDFTSIPFDGKTPDKLACDTTLRELPDGSWVMVMLGGGDTEPRPENHVLLARSQDKGKTWSPMQPLDFGFSRKGDTIATVPSELMVLPHRCTLFFATHDGTFAGWKEWLAHSADGCRTWSKPEPAPGRLHDRSFIRNHIVTRDGRILLPFQHYRRVADTKVISGNRRFSTPTDPRNGVLVSHDGGKTWSERGNIRISKDDSYHGWAENNIVELGDGRIAMIIRADGLGGVLYYAESKDGGTTWPEFAVKSDIPNPGSKATLYPLGGDTVALLHNPNPKGRHPLALWISFDGMKTWPYQRVLVEHSSDGPGRSLNYPDGFVSKDKRWLHFAYDDNRHRAVHYSAKLPPLPAPKADTGATAAASSSRTVASTSTRHEPRRRKRDDRVQGHRVTASTGLTP